MLSVIEGIRKRLFEREPVAREPQLGDLVDFFGPYHNITDGPNSNGAALASIRHITTDSHQEKVYGLFPASDWFDKKRGENGEMWITLAEVRNGALDIEVNGRKTFFIPTYVPKFYFRLR